MTNAISRDASGTAHLNPESGVNVIGGQQNALESVEAIPLQRALPGARFSAIPAEQGKGVLACRLEIFDLRGAMNMQRGIVADGHVRLADSTSETRYEGYAHPPLKTTSQSIVTTTPDTVLWANFLKRLVMATTGGAGALAASKLIAEASATSPVLADTTYAFLGGGACYGLWAPFYIGASATPNLAVGTSAAIDLLTTLGSPPTSIGQMDAATAGATGLIQLPLPDLPFLIQAGTQMLYGLGTSARAQALTVAQTGISPGWQAIDSLKMGGSKAKVFWRRPKGISSVQTMFGATPGEWEIVSTNPYGGDTQTYDMGLDNITGAARVRDGLVITDDDRLIFYNGRIDELGWKTDRKYSSTQLHTNRAITVIKKRELIADVCLYGSGATTQFWRERYDWDLRAWQVISKPIELTDGSSTKNLLSARGSPSGPYAPSTGYLHGSGGSGVTTARFHRKFEPPPGVNPYSLRGTQDFETSSFVLLPGLIFPAPFTNLPKVVAGIYFGGDATGGGTTLPTPGAVRVEVGEMGFTANAGTWHAWKAGNTIAGRYHDRSKNEDRILIPQIRITGTQGSDTTLIPQFLPITIDFYCFTNARKKKGWLWWS